MDLKYTQRSLGLLCHVGRSLTGFVCLQACVHTSGFLETFVSSQGAGWRFLAHRVCALGNF